MALPAIVRHITNLHPSLQLEHEYALELIVISPSLQTVHLPIGSFCVPKSKDTLSSFKTRCALNTLPALLLKFSTSSVLPSVNSCLISFCVTF